MFLIVGLGNPGRQYENTRHNVGFDVIDIISRECGISLSKQKFKGICGEGSISGEKVILLKPQTFMNLSGESIREAARFYSIPSENVIVIYDDISLEVGRLRIRLQGSAGGHNGIKSTIAHLSTDVFPRIKVGVGNPELDMVTHVLGRFPKEEREKVEEAMHAAAEAAAVIVKFGTNEAMGRYNGFRAK